MPNNDKRYLVVKNFLDVVLKRGMNLIWGRRTIKENRRMPRKLFSEIKWIVNTQ